MPPRKSSTPRTSDATTARFVPDPSAMPLAARPASSGQDDRAPAPVPAATTTNPTASNAAEERPASADAKESVTSQHAEAKKESGSGVAIEDLALPKSIIMRLAKGALPPNTQLQANAILALTKSATVFINYLSNSANEYTLNSARKTITPADVFKALDDVEMPFMRATLEAEFDKFNTTQSEKRTNYRQKVKAAKAEDTEMGDASVLTAGDTTIADSSMMDTSIQDAAPAAKKARVDPDASASNVNGADGAETEDDHEVDDDDHEDDEVEIEEESSDEGGPSGDETQDALEVREKREERDEALDGDESD